MQLILKAMMLLGWAIPWSVGGILVTSVAFRLRRGEVVIVGIGLGLVLQLWLANIAAQLVVVPLAFWVGSLAILAVGVVAQAMQGTWRMPQPGLWTLAALAGLTVLFSAIGRGLGIFDDYQNLPTVSLIASGDVPPHFALDPSLRFGYHYLLLLFAAELMRLGSLSPWSALDLARGVVLALPLVLAAHWAFRVTRRWFAAVLCSLMLAFAGGARWLLLLLPPHWLARISDQIALIGSASTSASSLAQAMISPWKIDGAAPMAFPFAFYSGINPPYIMLYTGIAGSGVLILLLLLLTATRWRNRWAPAVSAGLMAALAMANEIAFLLLGLGIVLACLVGMVREGTVARTPRPATWLGIALSALVIAGAQGGMMTEVARGLMRSNAGAASYFDATPRLVWPPAIVSAHFGSLSLVSPLQLLVALLEIGPIVVVTPAVAVRGWHAIRKRRWLEAGLIASSVGVFAALFLSFKGPLFTAAPRLLSTWLLVCALYFVPLAWVRSARGGDSWRIGWLSIGAAAGLGGLVLFTTQLLAIQRPVYTTFITELDASMARRHWNQLEIGALVFDPLIYRAPTVLGRPTRSSPSWYERSEAWERLRAAADPGELSRAGFGYMYVDGQFWEQLNPAQQRSLTAPCVREIDRVDGVRSEADYTKDFRLLLDISACG